jgi:hypothetical protein
MTLILGIFIGATIGYITAALMAAPNYSEIPTSSTDKDNLTVEEGTEINEVLDKIRAEIETTYARCDLCEWDVDYDYDETDISEYKAVGDVADILKIIDKYKNGDEK